MQGKRRTIRKTITGRTIRAWWSRGRLELLENLELPDGKEVTVTITGSGADGKLNCGH
jgi:hypothetical protein